MLIHNPHQQYLQSSKTNPEWLLFEFSSNPPSNKKLRNKIHDDNSLLVTFRTKDQVFYKENFNLLSYYNIDLFFVITFGNYTAVEGLTMKNKLLGTGFESKGYVFLYTATNKGNL